MIRLFIKPDRRTFSVCIFWEQSFFVSFFARFDSFDEIFKIFWIIFLLFLDYYFFLTSRIVLLFWHSDFYSLYNRNTFSISNSLFEVWNLDWNKLREMKPLNGGFRWSWLFILLLINEGFLAGETWMKRKISRLIE